MVDIILCCVMAKLGVKTVNEVGAVAIRGGVVMVVVLLVRLLIECVEAISEMFLQVFEKAER
jgi:uncharacterized membrane protein